MLTCSQLYIPHSIKREPFDYLVGSTVYIDDCADDYTPEGPRVYECVQQSDSSATWEPIPETRCIGKRLGKLRFGELSSVTSYLISRSWTTAWNWSNCRNLSCGSVDSFLSHSSGVRLCRKNPQETHERETY